MRTVLKFKFLPFQSFIALLFTYVGNCNHFIRVAGSSNKKTNCVFNFVVAFGSHIWF